MSNPPMYGELQPLDREVHKNLKLDVNKAVVGQVADQNSVFLTAVEFGDACKEYPVVFVRAGQPGPDGKAPIAPLAVLGLKPGSNLFVDGDKWTGNYVPAYIRRYPFAMARIDGSREDSLAVCYDAKWSGFNDASGEALFKDGEPTEFLLNARTFLENFEQESERTRLICNLLVELDLLQDMRFEATLPGGEKIDVEGFLALDEKKYAELADDKVLQLHRNGLTALIEMHRLSMSNMNRLASRYAA
ncbi:SapC family protein [Pelomonas cellulosilytica]|uniref:SapC family protein n=1 Tax=Pelomonas cellulosilytica TaxID=2906762 RepID=A0ABS8XVM8_9BURK|nr:SapC family protein [Pelomonas sp. P8]MCE4554691.1 SapC family protein [Pelomonas sp. P8]